MRRSIVVLATFISAALPEASFADPPIGNLGQEERAEVVFRTLAGPLPSDHGGVYVVYSDTQTVSPTDPTNGNKHTIVEMVGLTGTSFDVACVPLFAAVASTSGIAQKTLTSFVNAARYWGSYRNPAFDILRGQNEADGTRMGILRVAAQLRERNPSVPYAVNPGECVYRLLTNYMSASGSGATVDIGEITRMRSDAFVEYTYAANDVPILVQNITNRSDMQYVDRRAAFYNPRTQRGRLQPTEIEYPVITLIDGIDGSPLPNMATSTTTVKIRVQDQLSGPGRLELSKSGVLIAVETTAWDGTSHTYSSADTGLSTMSNLANGQYSVRAIDQAGNVTSGAFTVNTTPQGTGSIPNATQDDASLGGVASSTNSLSWKCPDNTGVGISQVQVSGPGYSRTWDFDAAPTARVGIATGLAQGTFTLTCVNLAGSSSTRTVFYSTASIPNFVLYGVTPQSAQFEQSQSVSTAEIGDVAATRLRIRVQCQPGGYCDGSTSESSSQACAMMKLYSGSGQEGQGCHHAGDVLYSELLLLPQSASFIVKNTSLTATNFTLSVEAALYKFGAYDRTVSTVLPVGNGFSISPNGVMTASVSIQEVDPNFQAGYGQNSIESQIKSTSLASWGCSAASASAARQLLWLVQGSCIESSGSDLVFLNNSTMSFTVQGSTQQPTIDQATTRIYEWTGSSWSLSGISRQGAAVSTSAVVVATGSFSRSGQFAVLFSVSDGTVPLTTWSIEGSSSAFQGIVSVATYSYLVLSSTDPVVNGFHSGLATTYYRIDGLPGDAFSAYSSSLSFLPGTHWVDYYAVDWAGNQEAVKRATVTVTAGSVTRLSGDLQVDGNLLVGFLGSGAKAETVARAEYDYNLMVSSQDGRALLAVDNAGFVSIGTAPASGRLTLAGVSGDTALALRSGNSTASVTGAQLAFGYDGTGNLRHGLYTQHGSAANDNKMVFELWTPAAASSATLGSFPVLSLEGSTITPSNALVHVMPAGIADKELVVSNGTGMGEGSVLRWDRWTPSAKILKQDIERLGRADEERAYGDVAALRPVRYRRRNAGPDAPFERGYVYEETPQSVRDGPGAVSLDERLVNAELALKALKRRIEELKARIEKAKAAKQ